MSATHKSHLVTRNLNLWLIIAFVVGLAGPPGPAPLVKATSDNPRLASGSRIFPLTARAYPKASVVTSPEGLAHKEWETLLKRVGEAEHHLTAVREDKPVIYQAPNRALAFSPAGLPGSTTHPLAYHHRNLSKGDVKDDRVLAQGFALPSPPASPPLTINPLLVSQIAKLTADDATDLDLFGGAVAISGTTLVVGAFGTEVGGKNQQGAAYVFEQDGAGIWYQVAKLTADDGQAGDEFGSSVGISGDTIVVGAHFAAIGGQALQGAAYIFERTQEGV